MIKLTGEKQGMRLGFKYYQQNQNCGDAFSRRLAERLFDVDFDYFENEPVSMPNVVLVGSILHWVDRSSIVCGTGLLSSKQKVVERPKKLVSVRGPLTARELKQQGISPPRLMGDPGVLAPALFPVSQRSRHKLGIIPHYVDAENSWIQRCRRAGIPIIDVLAPLEEFFSELQSCKCVLSSSLHGLIFAHAYGIPAVWVELSDRVLGQGFKFLDYFCSAGIPESKIRRVKLAPEDDPFEIAKFAELVPQAALKNAVEYAVEETYLTIRQFL